MDWRYVQMKLSEDDVRRLDACRKAARYPKSRAEFSRDVLLETLDRLEAQAAGGKKQRRADG